MRNSQKINESLNVPPSDKTVLVRGNRPCWGGVCSLYCGVTNQQTCVVTVGCRLIPSSAEDYSSFSTSVLHVTCNDTEMDFLWRCSISNLSPVLISQSLTDMCVQINQCSILSGMHTGPWESERQTTYGLSALLLRSEV